VQLIAGGSGVVPLMAMTRAHHGSGSTAPFRLLYSVRTPENAYFREELAGLGGDSFRVDWVYTRQAPAGWPAAPGRLMRDSLESASIAASQRPTVYVCGPTGFVEAAAGLLLELGHDEALVRTERFGGY
jgi:ferredoxin-NADP reductase